MKKVTSNNEILVGDFRGPDIEEGTFHHFDIESLSLHQNGTKKCPCPPIECHETEVSDDSIEDNEKNSDSKD
jgi:hypothetical protein